MKKIQYMAPTTEVYRIELHKMIAISNTTLGIHSGGSSNEVTDESDLLSRRHSSVWGDNE